MNKTLGVTLIVTGFFFVIIDLFAMAYYVESTHSDVPPLFTILLIIVPIIFMIYGIFAWRAASQK